MGGKKLNIGCGKNWRDYPDYVGDYELVGGVPARFIRRVDEKI